MSLFAHTAAMATRPDHALLEAYVQTRDAEAFRELVRRHSQAVLQTCHRTLGCQTLAEDATQETFFKLMRQAHQVQQSLAGWLHKTATHLCIDRIRHEQRLRARNQKAHALHQQATGASDTHNSRPAADPTQDALTWAEWGHALDACLAELPDGDHALLVEHFVNGRPLRELAEEKGCSAATVHRRIQKALAATKDNLAERGFDRLACLGVSGFAAALVSGLTEAAQAAPTVGPMFTAQLNKLILASQLTGTVSAGLQTNAGGGAFGASSTSSLPPVVTHSPGLLLEPPVLVGGMLGCLAVAGALWMMAQSSGPTEHLHMAQPTMYAQPNTQIAPSQTIDANIETTFEPVNIASTEPTVSPATPFANQTVAIHPNASPQSPGPSLDAKHIVSIHTDTSGNQHSVAFGDGHVETIHTKDLNQRLQQQTGQTLQEWVQSQPH